MAELGTGKYLAASFIGLGTSYLNSYGNIWSSGSGILATTAFVASDEFYDQAEYVHTIASNVRGGILIGIGVVSAIGAVSLPADIPALILQFAFVASTYSVVQGAVEIIANSIIVPAITNKIHEFTHPHNDHVTLTGHFNDMDVAVIA